MNHPSQQQQMPMPNQMHQNVGQQRQTPGGQQKPGQGQQYPQAQSVKYDPQLCLFVLEKTKTDKSWDDVVPFQQHIPLSDLQDTLNKTRRKKISVKESLDEISSGTIRHLLFDLVEDENKKLVELNRTIHWKMASVSVDWVEVKRGHRQIKRVSVLLETEPSGFQEPIKPSMNGAQGMQDMNKAGKQQGPMQNPGGKVPQHGPPMGPNPQFEQQQRMPNGPHNMPGGPGGPGGQQAPPPPPPPPAGHPAQFPQGVPPPPPMAQHPNMQPGPGPQHAHNGHPQKMPGAYPTSAPRQGARNSQPHIEVMDDGFLYQKKGRRDFDRRESSEDDSEDDSDVEGDDGNRRRHRRRHEEGEYGSKRSHNKKDRTPRANRSKKRSSSGTRLRNPFRSKSPHHDEPRRHRKHRSYDKDGYQSDIKYHRYSSSDSSSSGGSHRSHREHRRHRRSRDPLDDMRREKRRSEEKYKSHRDSWDAFSDATRGSHSSSASRASTKGSSAYSAQDRIFDEAVRRHSRNNSGQSATPQHILDDINRRARDARDRLDDRYNDYPEQPSPRRYDYFAADDLHARANPYPTGRPQAHINNPLSPRYGGDGPQHMPGLRRASTYAGEPDAYARTTPRYAHERDDDPFKVDQLADALLDRMQEKQQRNVPLQRRFSTQQRATGHTPDVWDERAPPMGYPPSYERRY